MAAPVVESYNTGSSSTRTVTITKPTGLSVGDLMWLYLTCFSDTDPVSLTTPSGWTASNSETGGSNKKAYSFWKFADSADVAASNFSFTWTSSDSTPNINDGVIVRISNVAPTPIRDSQENFSGTNTASFSSTVDVDPMVNDALYLLMYFSRGDSNDPTAYTITGTNPTWTELFSVGDAGDMRATLAWGNAADATVITNVTVTLSAANSNNWINLVALSEQKDATATLDTLSVSPTFNALTPSSGVTATLNTLLVSPTLNAPAANGTTPTQWTKQSKNPTDWTKQNKSL